MPGSAQAYRFVFVDGLRGLAALSIVVFHIWNYEPEPWPAFEYSHWLVNAAFKNVRAAVQVLLVVSGFVVAYTLRKSWVTPREVGSFLGRRIVRLIPPYWVTIGIVIVVDLLCVHALNLEKPFEGPLSVPRVSKHLTLTQEIFRHEDEALSAGVWTICIEMQFYVVAILGIALAQRLAKFDPHSTTDPIFWLGAACRLRARRFDLPVLLAVPEKHRRLGDSLPLDVFPWHDHLVDSRAHCPDPRLCIGCRRGHPATFFTGVPAGWISETSSRLVVPNAVALSTAVAILAAGRLNRMQSWLSWSWVQYLGRISYSLYLIHFPVCHLLTSAAWKWCNNSPTPSTGRSDSTVGTRFQ